MINGSRGYEAEGLVDFFGEWESLQQYAKSQVPWWETKSFLYGDLLCWRVEPINQIPLLLNMYQRHAIYICVGMSTDRTRARLCRRTWPVERKDTRHAGQISDK